MVVWLHRFAFFLANLALKSILATNCFKHQGAFVTTAIQSSAYPVSTDTAV